MRIVPLCFATGVSLFLAGWAFGQESGYQVIQGTRVYTQIDHAADNATFSNDCGSQTISHQDLAAGAIPTDIIPCPRPGAVEQSAPEPQPEPAPAPQAVDPEPAPPPPASAPVAEPAPVQSTGSYAQTCSECRESAGALSCSCRRIDQTYMQTSIDYGQCQGAEIENIDGRLRCVRMNAGGSGRPQSSIASGGQPGAPDACIEMGKTMKVSSACDFKDGVPMYRTYMRVDQRPDMHCPRDIEVEFTEMASGQVSTHYIGPRFSGVDTCGGGIVDAHVKAR